LEFIEAKTGKHFDSLEEAKESLSYADIPRQSRYHSQCSAVELTYRDDPCAALRHSSRARMAALGHKTSSMRYMIARMLMPQIET